MRGARYLVRKVLDRIQPVGSLYFSTSSASPASLFGGTWERYAQGRVMVSASDTDTDFTAGKAGGEKTHSHKYGIIYGDFYGMMIMRPTDDVHTGVIDYALTQGNRIGPHTRPVISETVIGHADTVSGSYSKRSTSLYQNEGNTTRASSMEPYVAVYIWRRTA
nr:MAG TPA: baseplate wedge protein [Caudoviricetes sp.]